MKKTEAKFTFTTNSRILKDQLTRYKNTFEAFCELVNNSIQAQSSKIDITIDYAKTELSKSPIKKIVIKDYGWGVADSDFEKKILEVGTDVKDGGEGVGRFAALQIGSQIEIETVAFDKNHNSHTKVVLPLNSDSFKNQRLGNLDFHGTKEILKGKPASYYQVTIKSLHHNQHHKTDRKNKLSKEFLEENIRVSLFERYPYEIFNEKIQFSVNNKRLKKNEFIDGDPAIRKEKFTDMLGEEHIFKFYFYKVKLNDHKAKVFFQLDNSGLKTVASSYQYSSEWFSKEMGSWFIYIESSFLTMDIFHNIEMDELGNDGIDKLKSFTKDIISEFFISINTEFYNFTEKLRESYPDYEDNDSASETQKFVFEQFAYIAEQKYKLLDKNNGLKDIVYPLMNKAIGDGNIASILDSLLKTDKTTTDRFKELLKVTDMSNVVHFTTDIAKKVDFLDFLHKLNYGEIANNVQERSVLHKIVEKELWLFGEAYNGIPNLIWSDKRLLGIFEELRKEHLNYELTSKDDNLVELNGDGLNDITDLFFTNERPLENSKREFMIVELKAPRCKITSKEITQIKKYGWAIESNAAIGKSDSKFKLLLIAADMNGQAKSEMKSAYANYKVPFLLERKVDHDIEIYIMTWSELISGLKGKLSYLSQHLKIKDRSVKEKFEEEYPHLISQKMRTVLKKIAS